MADFFAAAPEHRGGVRVAVKYLDADRYADVVAGDAVGTGSRVRDYLGHDLTTGSALPAFDLDAFPGTFGGVYVG